MKELEEITVHTDTVRDDSKVKGIWEKCAARVKHGKFSCPFCREEFKGLSAFVSHLKAHCT